MAISQLNANDIINISTDFGRKFNLKEEEEDEIKKILIERGYKKFYIFRYIAKVKNFLIVSNNKKFTIEVPTVEQRDFLEDLNKACFIKITKRRKKENVFYSNEIYATVNVYY